MSATLTKREAETRLWEAYRPALEYLFIVQNRTRNEIRDLMATMLGFDRSPSQYDARFKKWGFRKNFHQEEWRQVDHLEIERKRNGRPSVIKNAGRVVKRTPNRRHRYHESTLERIQREMGMQVQSAEIQLALVPRTPSPKPCANGYIDVSKTLWYSCLDSLNKLFKMPHQTPTLGIPQQATEVLFREIPRTMFQDPYKMNDSILSSRGRKVLRSRLLESPCRSIIDIEDTIALRSGQAFLDLLKLALYLISNNIAENTGIGPLIVSACQLPTTAKALDHLLQQKTPTVQAFADGLLHYAFEANDKELIRKLIHSGVSVNSKCGVCELKLYADKSRLGCAIIAKADQAAISLLELGADPDKRADGKCLSLSFQSNLISLADELLQRGVGNTASWEISDISAQYGDLDIISTAALHGGMAAVKLLTHYHPLQLQHAIENQTSIAFVLAASIGNETLVRFWLKRYNVSTKSCAIGLCGAAANGQTQIVELLISHGSVVHGDHGWIYHRDGRAWSMIYCDVTAIEAALGSDHLTTAKVLIDHGAHTEIKTSILNALLWPWSDSETVWLAPNTVQEIYRYRRVVLPHSFTKRYKGSVSKERMKIFRLCLTSGAEADGETLVWLSFAGALDLVHHLLNRGFSINTVATISLCVPTSGGKRPDVTPLAAALFNGNDDVVEYLLQNRADVNKPAGSEGNISPLAASIFEGRLDRTKLLICSGSDPKDPMALLAAAHTDSIDAYNIVATATMDVQDYSVAENTIAAASEAIRRGNKAFLRAILDHGINMNHPSENHPLFVAVRHLDIAAVQMLLAAGADPEFCHHIHDDNVSDGYHPFPILSAFPQDAPTGEIISLASTLIEAGASLDYPGRTDEFSPLVMAISRHRPMAFIEFLIRKGALVNALSDSSWRTTTPLCQAVCSGSYQVVQLLINEGARVSGPPQLSSRLTPRTSIQLAARFGYLDILKLLLEALGDKSRFLEDYPLALRLAHRTGHRAVAGYLQAYRAEKFGHSECATDEVILKDFEDEEEDRKYWYEFWKDEHFKTWRSIDHSMSPEGTGNFEYVLGLSSSVSSINEDIDSKKEGSVSSTITNSSEKLNRENDLDWREYFDFDMAQHPGDMDSYGLATDGGQLSTFVDHWPFDDTSQTYESDNEVLSLDGLSMTQDIGGNDCFRLEEQIWDIEDCMDQAPWEGFFD